MGRGEFQLRGKFHHSEKFNVDTMTGQNIMALQGISLFGINQWLLNCISVHACGLHCTKRHRHFLLVSKAVGDFTFWINLFIQSTDSVQRFTSRLIFGLSRKFGFSCLRSVSGFFSHHYCTNNIINDYCVMFWVFIELRVNKRVGLCSTMGH